MQKSSTSAPKLYRVKQGRVLTGLSLGLSVHLGVNVHFIRALWALLCIFGPVTVALYFVMSIFIPSVQTVSEASNSTSPAYSSKKYQRTGWDYLLLALASVLWLVRFVMQGKYNSPATFVVIFIVSIAVGSYLVWVGTDKLGEKSKSSPNTPEARSAPTSVWVIVAGVVLFIIGFAGGTIMFVSTREPDSFLGIQGQGSLLLTAVIVVVILVAALLIMLIPLWTKLWHMGQSQAMERATEQERMRISTQIHDSVLQTLTLIQKTTQEPETAQRARAQERQLRQWLFEPEESVDTSTLFGAFRQACGHVEDSYSVQIRPVLVGDDTVLSPAYRQLILAAREALVNAAKHSGCTEVSAFLERIHKDSSESISISVKDRGQGFDMEDIPADRQGIKNSIVGRVQDAGGTATFFSNHNGTEVELMLTQQGEHS